MAPRTGAGRGVSNIDDVEMAGPLAGEDGRGKHTRPVAGHPTHNNDGEAVGTLVDGRESQATAEDAAVLPSSRSCRHGLRADTLRNDWQADDVQERGGSTELQRDV